MKSEKQLPIKMALSIIIVSSLLFTGITFGFGFRIDRNTGDMIINSPLTNQNVDTWSYDPMTEVWGDFWQYYALAGFFGSIAMFVFCLFELEKEIAEDEKKKKVIK